jgi:hypothetical protein
MTLGELITALEAADPTRTVRHGFTHPHSYRGDYMDLAFDPDTDVTVADMLADARSALGTTYQGWKGGDFTMSEHTWCWLSEEGDASGETISALLLELMLAAPAAPSAPADRAAILREAADRIKAMTDEAYDRALSDDEIGYGNGLENAADELRRMADEAQPVEFEFRGTAEIRVAVLREAADLVAQFTGNDLDVNAKMLRRVADEAQQPNPQADRLGAAARRALESLNDLILDSRDPGPEAIAARYELEQVLLTSSAGPAPATDPTERRDRWETHYARYDAHDYRDLAAIGMAIADAEQDGMRATIERLRGELKQQPDRAAGPAALREAAAFYESVLQQSLDPDSDPRYCTAVRDVVMGLRRRADEAQQDAAGARSVPLAASCACCGHRFDEHNRFGCCVGNQEVRCGCSAFVLGEKPAPVDPRTILGIALHMPDGEAQQPTKTRFEALKECICTPDDCPPLCPCHADEPPAAAQQPKEADNPRTVCVCGHTRGEHLVVSGRLLCDACDPDSTSNLVCKEFDAL